MRRFFFNLLSLSQKNFGSILTGSETWLPVGSAYLSHTELHHISSLILTFHINLMFGCLTCVLKVYTMRSLLQAIQDFKVVGFVTQPWIVSSILKSPIPDEYDLSSLKAILCGGAIVDKNLCLSFYKRFGTALINIWGMTEVVSCFQNDFQGTIAGIAFYIV
jgi:acyl-coenzyme A synthetase/AMP-(fatty) acid ligase